MVLANNNDKKSPDFTKKRTVILKKGLQFLPHLFTLGNAFFGFCSVIFASQGYLFSAAYLILLGALMDALDGRIARMVGSSSDFGVQLDSLSDAISFCLAPAFLLYFWQLKKLGFFGIIISFLFLAAGLMRLARFNIMHNEQKDFFLGLPTTVAGCFIATVLLNFKNFEAGYLFLVLTPFITITLSALMISSVRFPTFKQKLFNLNKNWYVVSVIILFAFISILQLHEVLLILFLLYFVLAIFTTIRLKR